MITVPRAPAAMAMAAVPSLTVRPLPYADAKATNRKTAAAINTLGISLAFSTPSQYVSGIENEL